jgi:hypothetical protein
VELKLPENGTGLSPRLGKISLSCLAEKTRLASKGFKPNMSHIPIINRYFFIDDSFSFLRGDREFFYL